MSNVVKHKQRSHYSYRNNNAAVFSGFESRATRKNVQMPIMPGFFSRIGDGIKKIVHRTQDK